MFQIGTWFYAEVQTSHLHHYPMSQFVRRSANCILTPLSNVTDLYAEVQTLHLHHYPMSQICTQKCKLSTYTIIQCHRFVRRSANCILTPLSNVTDLYAEVQTLHLYHYPMSQICTQKCKLSTYTIIQCHRFVRRSANFTLHHYPMSQICTYKANFKLTPLSKLTLHI